MKHKKILTVLFTAGIVLLLAGKLSLPTHAASTFDPAYYAATYPDVTLALGTDPQTLLNHYIAFGMAEGRTPYQGAAPGALVDGMVTGTVITPSATTGIPVPVNQLANLSSLKKKQTDAEFNQAYNVAWQTVAPLHHFPGKISLWALPSL